MKDPLAFDKALVKEYKIPPEVELHPRQKLAFLEEQLHQFKAMHFRARVDLMHATRLKDSDNKIMQDKGLQQAMQHRNEVEQTIGGIGMVSALIEQLRKEYPNLGGELAHPED